jgi:hypothetical protein
MLLNDDAAVMERNLSTSTLVGFTNKMNDAMDFINYPNVEHSTKVIRGICDVSCYKKILQARQVAICAFLKKVECCKYKVVPCIYVTMR